MPLASREEGRVLILAPMGKDAVLIRRELESAAIDCHVCRDRAELSAEASNGVGALLLSEEALVPAWNDLAAWLDGQETWSDLPILLLTHAGSSSLVVADALARLGNLSLLERPVRVAALLSTVRSALRARERQYAIREHLREREGANLRKDQFLATLAHELRNPLAPIASCIALLRARSSDPLIEPICEILERQSRQMIRLVDDLMDVSRITRGKIALRLETIDLADVVRTAIETSGPLIEAAEHQLEVTLPSRPVCVTGDVVRLSQVVSNLLANAAKYTDAGGRIAVTLRSEGSDAVIEVADNGIGIPASALATVFDLFAQVNAYDERARGGLGIGLTLARTMVQMHEGSITARSAGPGQGSTFEVRLPLLPQAGMAQPAPAAESRASIATRRVLVVDDNRDAADALGFLLGTHGAEVRVAYDGTTALEAIRDFVPEVAVLDLGMPGITGFELARHLREVTPARVVLIALTGWGQQHDRLLSAEAGFDHHLVKPVEWAELQRLIATTVAPKGRGGDDAPAGAGAASETGARDTSRATTPG
jgi:signal transduction histidine kinase/ActR/RegA family two-component response regulator